MSYHRVFFGQDLEISSTVNIAQQLQLSGVVTNSPRHKSVKGMKSRGGGAKFDAAYIFHGILEINYESLVQRDRSKDLEVCVGNRQTFYAERIL